MPRHPRNVYRAELVGLSLSMQEREAFYVPVRQGGTTGAQPGGLFEKQPVEAGNTANALPMDVVIPALKPILENPTILKIGQNLKYDMLVLRNHGIEVRGTLYDTMVASYVLRSDGQHNLDALAMEAFRYRMIPFEDLVGKGKSQKTITEVHLQALADYSAEDADLTLRIFGYQRPRLSEQQLLRLCQDIEFPLIPVLTRMEYAGIALDSEYLAGMSKELERLLEKLVSEIHRHAGRQFNINSTQQLGDARVDECHFVVERKEVRVGTRLLPLGRISVSIGVHTCCPRRPVRRQV